MRDKEKNITRPCHEGLRKTTRRDKIDFLNGEKWLPIFNFFFFDYIKRIFFFYLALLKVKWGDLCENQTIFNAI